MAGQGSARVTLKEIDLSQVNNPQQQPQGVPAAVVGPARKGPAFVPRTFANIQQFSDTFGDMLEVSKDSNSNLFGPLALDQWLQTANAGTFIRTLGIGDGTRNANGAGFVVGSKQINKDSNKVNDNDQAAAGSTELGRSMVLGCFMKDATNSKLLQDAGIQVDDVSGTLTIAFGAEPAATDTIQLIGVSASGESKIFNITFTGDNADNSFTEANGQLTINVDPAGSANKDEFAAMFSKALVGKILNGNDFDFPGNAININPSEYFETSNLVAGQVIITQKGDGTNTNTEATFNVTEDITVSNDSTSITKSSADQTVTTTNSGASVASTIITVAGIPTDDSTITITDMLDNSLEIRIEADSGQAVARDVGAGTVKLGVDTLNAVQIAAKIEDAITFGIAVAEGGFQDQPGANTVTVTDNGDGTITLTSALAGPVDLFSIAGDATDNITEVQTDGSNGNPSSVTLTFSGLPNENDQFILDTIDESNNKSEAQTFIFIANAVGAANGAAVAAGEHIGKIQVELPVGDNLDILLSNIQNAIETIQPAFYVVSINPVNNSVTITNEKAQGFVQDRDFVFELNQNVSVQGQGNAVVGNHGPQSIDFTGGGGGASPIIRGLLMLPQGVRASLNPQQDRASGNYNQLTDLNDNEVTLRSIVINGKNFNDDSTDGSHLAGYQIGDVNGQGFDILLNGFKNTSEPAVLSCSFDPTAANYFANVLNTDPTKIEEKGHYLYANWNIEPACAVPSSSGLISKNAGSALSASNDSRMIGFLTQSTGNRNANAGANYEGFNVRYQTAKTPWFVSQYFSKPASNSRQSGNLGLVLSTGEAKKLFRLHVLDDGAVGSSQLRVLISGIRAGREGTYGSFDMFLELFDGDSVKGTVVAGWKNLNFDPESMNYIERVIGNQHTYYDFDNEDNRQRLVYSGNFEVRNRYVRVEVSDDVLSGSCPISALPAGFRGPSYIKSTGNFDEFGDDGAGTNKILADGSLSNIQIAPLPFVKTISRKLKTTSHRWEVDTSLPWGIKFASRTSADLLYEENSELSHNNSLSSWTKFYPAPISESDSGDADSFQNNFFSLEKIAVKRASTDGSDNSIDWNLSKYSRDGSLPVDDMSLNSFVDFEKDANNLNSKYLKFRCLFQGGFDGLNIFDADKFNQNNTAAYREANGENNDNSVTGPTIMAYRKALDVLTDKSAVELQLLAIPGIREPQVTNYAIKACEDRFDAMFVMDIEQIDEEGEAILYDSIKPHVRKTISSFEKRVLDTSFAAAYFPNVLVRRPSTGAPIEVPPSVCMLGVMARNDLIADPWFAPAGLRRGRLNAINSNLQMNRDLLDELYDVDINPIYEPSGRAGEVYAFGQKTLLQDQSALDRINVRRLLIDLRRKVKNVAQTLLFEPNRASTLQRFNSLVEPILADVQARQGVERYKVQIDSNTTTQNDVENNTIRGKIYLQPTKSVEFISLDFVVTNSIN